MKPEDILSAGVEAAQKDLWVGSVETGFRNAHGSSSGIIYSRKLVAAQSSEAATKLEKALLVP